MKLCVKSKWKKRNTCLQTPVVLLCLISDSVNKWLLLSGIEPKTDVVVTAEDQEGPLPSTLTKGIDWLLLFSLLFLISFIMYATVRTESIWWLIPGHDQEHQE